MKIKQQRFITSTAAVLMVCLLVSGYFAVAQSGSSDDPLVTQSYLDAVITPKAMQTAENAANAQANTLSARINELSQKLNESITAAAAAVASDETFLKFAKKEPESGVYCAAVRRLASRAAVVDWSTCPRWVSCPRARNSTCTPCTPRRPSRRACRRPSAPRC
mgnify:CR=1 FL=1